MFYEFAITVDAGTTETAPKEQFLPLTHGIIQAIHLQFPIGCAGLTHCRLEHHVFSQLPNNLDGNFATDGFIISITSPIEFTVPHYDVKFIGWNDDDTYPHTITVRFDMVDSKFWLRLLGILKGVETLLKVFKIKV